MAKLWQYLAIMLKFSEIMVNIFKMVHLVYLVSRQPWLKAALHFAMKDCRWSFLSPNQTLSLNHMIHFDRSNTNVCVLCWFGWVNSDALRLRWEELWLSCSEIWGFLSSRHFWVLTWLCDVEISMRASETAFRGQNWFFREFSSAATNAEATVVLPVFESKSFTGV